MRPTPFKRCSCLNPATGREYGKKCPKLSSKDHGSWWYRYEAPRGPDGRRRQPLVGPFRTKGDAEASLVQELARVRRDRHAATDRSLTVRQYLDDWIAGKAALSDRTRETAIEHIELYFKPGIGHIRLVDLCDRDFEDLYAAMRQLGRKHDRPSEMLRRLLAVRSRRPQPLSPARIRRIHATAMSALNTAVVRKKLITSNPAQFVELATGRTPKALVWSPQRVEYWRRTGRRPSPVMVWTPKQAGAFLDSVADDDLYALWHLVTYRGLRRGEAVGLPDYDVDLGDDPVVHVRETLARAADEADGPFDPDDPKSEAGIRVISLDAGTREVLAAYRSRQQERRLALGPAWVDSGRFFTRPTGEPLDPGWVTQRFGYLVQRAASSRTPCTGTTVRGQACGRTVSGGDRCHQHGGAEPAGTKARRDGLPPVRLHDLRHGSATYALAAGIPIKVVSEDLGHATTKITQDLYTSVLPELQQAAAEAVAASIPRGAPVRRERA